ncbi:MULTISPECIES: stage III sporulation protein AG [Paenibacillus]|uniref:Stage III sporulation protein AG n=1 Tax=Paenibacillus lignilyticus TaxID=1172615 RepID=A0ABS5CEW7_9BACL|nr:MULTISPECIES: stage III sporulation protein AG [Paenibacillus]MBP3964363.1 stage III sporulation protein AG [Paenibacillus lignilyticus]SFS83179.1 stage III sporulation protein AG [Paenibacillus sp. BC26]
MANWLSGLESTIGKGQGGPKRVKTLRWLLIIGLIGIGLMVVNSFLSYQKVPTADQAASGTPPTEEVFLGNNSSEHSSFDGIEQPLEARLKDILEKIVGVGLVDVFVTIDSTEEVTVHIDEKESQQITNEIDKNGGKRNITSITKEGKVVLYNTNGDTAPIIVKRIQPKVRGVLIVAKGAENGVVRRLIIDAVEKGLNVAINRISVVPRKHQ